MVVDDEQSIAEAIWEGTLIGPQRLEDMLTRGREGFAQAALLRGAAVALWSKHESQKTLFYRAG
jgi:hypothetical protein